jgi:hypothetical protein
VSITCLNASYYVIIAMNIIIVLINWVFKIPCMRAGDQKLMINLEWPYLCREELSVCEECDDLGVNCEALWAWEERDDPGSD